MDNNVSRRVKLLMAGVLVLFLVASTFEILQVGGEAFSRGFEEGYHNDRSSGVSHWVGLTLVDPDGAIQQLPGGVALTPIAVEGELEIPDGIARKPVGVMIASTTLVIIGMISFIAFIVSLINFACRFPRRPILSRENVISLRWIACTLGGFGLAAYGGSLCQTLWMRANVAIEGYRVLIDPPPSVIIVALILVAMTEIMNQAGKLQNEQELTI